MLQTKARYLNDKPQINMFSIKQKNQNKLSSYEIIKGIFEYIFRKKLFDRDVPLYIYIYRSSNSLVVLKYALGGVSLI